MNRTVNAKEIDEKNRKNETLSQASRCESV